MKILYFDCFDAVNLNLLLSAFMDAGVTKEYIYEKMCEHSFKIDSEKMEDDIIPSTKSDITVENDELMTSDSLLKLSDTILDDLERSLVNSTLRNVDIIKFSDYLKIRACIIAFLSLDVNYAVSSYLIESLKDEDGKILPETNVKKILDDNNIPYKIISQNGKLLSLCGVSLILALSKEYGYETELDIIKIAYGTDGKRYLRIVIGAPKNKTKTDFLQMEFKQYDIGVLSCGENK
ncbi:MAG: hypothetical protein E7391_00200 [Ruminococcaceae bacterium]|nr:hypothetical protein [Oscillospiraceae bacterium]